ncbi:hypothetical protein pb186bvf_000442 [Paramecium bursaria]
MQYLKDTFIVQGILSSSKRFLIVTEATLYIYESQDKYFKGQNPEDILNLLQYEVQNHKDSVMLLKDLKNQEKMFAFYSPSQDQIKVNFWFKNSHRYGVILSWNHNNNTNHLCSVQQIKNVKQYHLMK